jgi:hypothetical protein
LTRPGKNVRNTVVILCAKPRDPVGHDRDPRSVHLPLD